MRKTERELDLWEDTFRFSFALKLCFEFELHLNTGQVGDWGGKQQLDGQVHSAGEKSGLARSFLYVGFRFEGSWVEPWSEHSKHGGIG